MKYQTLSILSALAVVLFIASACNRPTPVGADLLDQDKADVFFTDTLSLITRSVSVDSVQTYSSDISRQSTIYLCGDLQDPIFGKAQSTIYSQFRFNSTPPNFENATLDSIVLLLQYDTTGFYGDTMNAQSVEIYRISETMDSSDTYFSNRTFAVDAQALGGAYNFQPKPTSLVELDRGADTLILNPHLRIRLDDAFGTELLDTTLYETEATFLETFHGLQVRAITPTETMMGFRLTGSLSRLQVFYTVDTTATSYIFPITDRSVKFTNFEHDYTGTDIPAFVNDNSQGDSLLFVQGMAGSNIEIEVPNAQSFGDIIVNQAELELTVAELPGDNTSNFTPPIRLILAEENDDNELLLIRDVTLSLAAFNGLSEEVDDGEGSTIRKYRLNLSSHFQNLVDGDTDKPLTLLIFGKQEVPTRTVLFGPGHSKYPAKLNFAYTLLN
ncbi:MAG: DUF4270 family protein [Bacteroidota bacterium]